MVVFASRRPANYSYSIYTVDGKRIENRSLGRLTADQMEKVDIGHLAQGTYIIELNADGATASRRVVKY
jgi:hypothetical protein